MTKAELISRIHQKTGYDKVSISVIVEEMMTSVKESLVAHENVYLRGFGTFQLKTRKEKVARNISKNTSIVVPQHDIPAFKASKEFVKSLK
ncbi:MAG: integration host factor subunit beta [Paludibacteraceae bacterium]|nr:integration host factor subunit beta [Paludibacteraceae bacterium]MBR1785839.1 integration host factor subunit beta [Paludibacteraceae bacterium]